MAKARRIKLPELLDISSCEDLKGQMLESLEHKADLAVHAANVRKISTPIVQVLIAAGVDAERRGVSFKFEECSPPFSEAFQSLGLSDYLDRWK